MITYDHPLNEKVRTLLRLEDLFERTAHFVESDHASDHFAALFYLFQISELTARVDLKSELLQDLERQKSAMETLKGNPDVVQAPLAALVEKIDQATSELLRAPPRTGQHLRDNEWLMMVKQRTALIGGLCESDIPSAHYWAHAGSAGRSEDLKGWLSPMWPIRDALSLMLMLLRESGARQQCMATDGLFQQTPAARSFQLIRISLESDLPCIPEVSANKFALNIRFLTPGVVERAQRYAADVPFELALCNV